MKKILITTVSILLIIIAIPLIILMFISLAFGIANRTNGRILSSGELRKYLLYVPPSYDANTPTPLVINIHGFSQWPANQAQVSQWNVVADEYGFIVVYPEGTGFPLRWRLRSADPGSSLNAQEEVTFISDLIDKLQSQYNIDPTRVYANGLSNGGGMSFMLACDLADRITAIGSVAGAYVTPFESCQPSRPVPMITFHGVVDPIVPFHGGPSGSFEIPFPDISTWVSQYAQMNSCDLTPELLMETATVTGIRYTDCEQDADVVFYTIADGGHTWPGGEPLPEWIAGRTSQEIDATRLMWEFFLNYHK
jgi:polyhydroxybutyrate depolymerase